MILNHSTSILFLSFFLISFCLVQSKLDLFPGETWETGYLEAADPSKQLFYYLFKCRNNNIPNPPLLIWLEGGPAYSSIYGIYSSGGPYIISNTTYEIVRNPYAWNEIADVLFIDQPAGTLFSIAKDWHKLCSNMTCVASDLVAFMLNLYKKHPDLLKKDLYIAGVSYAGHYVPAFARKILEAAPQIKIKGTIIFNGLIDFFIQEPSNFKFLRDNAMLSQAHYQLIKSFYAFCDSLHDFKVPVVVELCGQTGLLIYKELGYTVDPYNIEQAVTPNFADFYEDILLQYANRDDVQEALGVDARYQDFNFTVYVKFLKDMVESQLENFGFNLQHGLKSYLVYGSADFVMSAYGGEDVANDAHWEGQDEFIATPFKDWIINGEVQAEYREHDLLKFIKIPHTGHSIFHVQRWLGLEIYKELMNIKP